MKSLILNGCAQGPVAALSGKEDAVQQGDELAEGKLNLWLLHTLLLEQSLTQCWFELQLAHDE